MLRKEESLPGQLKKWFSQSGSQFVLILLAFSVALNVMFYLQLRGLRHDHSDEGQHVPPPLQIGERVPDLDALQLDSSRSKVVLQESKLLLVFSKDCPACQANFHNWTALEQEVGPGNVLYISVNPLEEARKYAQARRIEDRTILFADVHQARQAFKIARIPQTILVHDNQVRAIQLGVLNPGLVEQLSQVWHDWKDQRPSSAQAGDESATSAN